jgi:hypothetical protein
VQQVASATGQHIDILAHGGRGRHMHHRCTAAAAL